MKQIVYLGPGRAREYDGVINPEMKFLSFPSWGAYNKAKSLYEAHIATLKEIEVVGEQSHWVVGQVYSEGVDYEKSCESRPGMIYTIIPTKQEEKQGEESKTYNQAWHDGVMYAKQELERQLSTAQSNIAKLVINEAKLSEHLSAAQATIAEQKAEIERLKSCNKTVEDRTLKLLELTDEFVFPAYYSHTGKKMWKIANVYTKYSGETLVLCGVDEGIAKALDVAIKAISKRRKEYYGLMNSTQNPERSDATKAK